MASKRGRAMGQWLLRGAGILLGVIVLILLGTAIYTGLYNRQTESLYPPYEIADVDGVPMHYVSEGSGRPVVLIHGGSAYVYNFTESPLWELLTAQYHVIAVDRPGSGYSGLPDSDPDFETQAALIHGVIESLGLEEAPLLVGQSWGGGVAMAYALNYPDDLAGIMMLGGHPYFTPNDWIDPVYVLADTPVAGDMLVNTVYMPLGVHVVGPARIENSVALYAPWDSVPPDVAELTLRLQMRPSQVRAQAWEHIYFDETLAEIIPRYEEIDLPMLYMAGSLDTGSIEQYDLLLTDFPDMPLIKIEGADHFLWFPFPDETVEAVTQLWGIIDEAQ